MSEVKEHLLYIKIKKTKDLKLDLLASSFPKKKKKNYENNFVLMKKTTTVYCYYVL